MRINKFLAEKGIASRRHADEMISAGRVKINGQIATLGANVEEGDVVTIGGTFYCETLQTRYVIEKSTFVWNGTNWENYIDYKIEFNISTDTQDPSKRTQETNELINRGLK